MLLAGFALGLLGANGDGQAPLHPVTDTFFGVTVIDPYRYMESSDEAYAAWKARQLTATAAMLATARQRAALDSSVRSGPSYRITDLTLANGRIFYMKHGADYDALVERDRCGGDDHTIVTDKTLVPDGSGFLGAFAVSNDAKTVALHVFTGRDQQDIHIVRASDGRDLEAPIRQVIFDFIEFTRDDTRILYAKAPQARNDRSIPSVSYDYAHRLGTDQTTDRAVFGAGISPLVDVPPHAFAFVDTTVSDQAMLAEVRDVAAGGSRFYTAPFHSLGTSNVPWRALGTAADGYTTVAVHGTTIDLATSANAPNYAVVRGDLVGEFAPQFILPPSSTAVVSGTLDGIPKAGIFALNAAADGDYVQLLERGVARMVRIPWTSGAKPIPVTLPLDNSSILEVATDAGSPGALIHLTSWTEPGDVYAFDPTQGSAQPCHLMETPSPPARAAEELSALADDGTPIPVSVVHRPGIKLDGSHPLILQVAGAYGFSLTPDFRSIPEAWLAKGGIYAVAHVRGGGELGEAWHRAGMGDRKSRSWTDLIAAAQMLIDRGYTSSTRLNLYGTTQSYLGGIASGIVIGRAIEERPDLFAAAVVDAPAFDMIRSERTALGRQSVSEFGSVASRAGFEALLAMSPYEHVQSETAYPPVLIRSFSHLGLGDDWQAAKMAARLQSAGGRQSVAYLDIVHDAPGDARGPRELRYDALAFFLLCDR